MGDAVRWLGACKEGGEAKRSPPRFSEEAPREAASTVSIVNALTVLHQHYHHNPYKHCYHREDHVHASIPSSPAFCPKTKPRISNLLPPLPPSSPHSSVAIPSALRLPLVKPLHLPVFSSLSPHFLRPSTPPFKNRRPASPPPVLLSLPQNLLPPLLLKWSFVLALTCTPARSSKSWAPP